MKLKSFLLLISILFMGFGAARASCPEGGLLFPAPGSGVKLAVKSGTCIAAPGQAARLRWDDSGSGQLQLFDSDDAGTPLIWCAHDNTGACARGSSLCLQDDGNLVIYAGSDCKTDPLWASNTTRSGDNEDGEFLTVIDVVGSGERAAILNDHNKPPEQIIWVSNNTD
jgi:hypothetical protein